MIRIILTLSVLLTLFMHEFCKAEEGIPFSPDFSSYLVTALEQLDEKEPETVLVKQIYQYYDHKLLWESRPDVALMLFHKLARAHFDGLTTEHFLSRILQKPHDHAPTTVVLRDIALTRGLVKYAQTLTGQRQLIPALKNEGILYAPFSLFELLLHKISRNDVHWLTDLAPPYEQYHLLKLALRQYRRVQTQGNWPIIPSSSPTLSEGDSHPDLLIVREQLRRLSFLHEPQRAQEEAMMFDKSLSSALKAFQKTHGLETDGVLGNSTRLALNIPPSYRIRQILLNMERWRVLPRLSEKRYILINTAGSFLKVIMSPEHAVTLPVIVGKPTRKTPLFAAPMTGFILNPSWSVPPGIKRDILQRAKEDPSYIKKQGLKVLTKDRSEVDPYTIDWTATTSVPYIFWQPPGEKNALGNIKFTLKNQDNILIHGTPDKKLFQKAQRALSSGCIRLEDPLKLVEALFTLDRTWPREEVEKAIRSGKQKAISLQRPLPVLITYFTVWGEDDGKVSFFPDVYGYDEKQLKEIF